MQRTQHRLERSIAFLQCLEAFPRSPSFGSNTSSSYMTSDFLSTRHERNEDFLRTEDVKSVSGLLICACLLNTVLFTDRKFFAISSELFLFRRIDCNFIHFAYQDFTTQDVIESQKKNSMKIRFSSRFVM